MRCVITVVVFFVLFFLPRGLVENNCAVNDKHNDNWERVIVKGMCDHNPVCVT